MHRKSIAWSSLWAFTAAVLLASYGRVAEQIGAGDTAPEIEASTWFNHVGQAPTLENLRGHAVLLEFWATWCSPCVAAWPHLQSLHEEHERDGLVVLALSAEAPEKISEFLDQKGYTVRTAAGATSNSRYGVRGIPHSVLIDPEGTITWRGHPNELTSGRIREALRRARKLPAGGYLAFRPSVQDVSSLSAALQAIEAGRIDRALTAAQRVAESESAPADDRAAAQALVLEIHEHLGVLVQQADALLARLEVSRASEVYSTLAKVVGDSEAGTTAKERLERIANDEGLQRELAAAEAFEKMRRSAARLSTSRQKSQYEQFAKRHAGTRAAERAMAFVRAN